MRAEYKGGRKALHDCPASATIPADKSTMLPPEIWISIAECCVANHYCDKNALLTLRTVSRLFNDAIRPYALRTLQLEFTRLDRVSQRRRRPLDGDALRGMGHLCKALYLDMMLIRDEGEILYLGNIFRNVPSMDSFVTTLYDRYCMNENSFTEVEYRESLGYMLERTMDVEAVRLNLPFQLISKHCQASTMLLGNTFEALAQRPEDSKTLKTLVLENMTDIGIVKLWRNPRDVKNIIDTFVDLKHLLISVRRHDDARYHVISFQQRLWEMIGKAGKLESLCLVSLNMDEQPFEVVRHSSQRDCTLSDWHFKSIPTVRKPPKSVLPYLTSLELRRVEIHPCGFLSLFKCFGSSLKELILNHVYLKTCYNSYAPDHFLRTLWIGLPNERPQQNHRWIAVALREMDVQLQVCRATNLGYDQYLVGLEPAAWSNYDLVDPSGLGRSLEERFVEVVTGVKQPSNVDGSTVEYWPEEEAQTWAHANKERPLNTTRLAWDAAAYMKEPENNTTSRWQKSIDGYFPNCNQFTLDELHRFADTACEGMNELNRRCAQGFDELEPSYREEDVGDDQLLEPDNSPGPAIPPAPFSFSVDSDED
ncbi:uncharacterized protein JN550_008205 [Neoarthrinium moseri]|uniref:uncharacterized protein n=1 Tax=Neoarthrinium moseri TaxID=1658444 RepID=UPI001FDE109E|nr:uncharacterized protein JN550_008205 [Neoarthrinium moseri]KAI1865448.1 hypothetical protein JN550_008205 [Neoarthrinium moseri]